ncbi:MAG: hypothetical protein ACOYNO_12370, partial [Saprospiraceae bacterium]
MFSTYNTAIGNASQVYCILSGSSAMYTLIHGHPNNNNSNTTPLPKAHKHINKGKNPWCPDARSSNRGKNRTATIL